ncbi:hypothetical protein B0F90DRAFT_1690235 [Multifurca ochricompacta]|uniref:Mediator complex subunit 16 C-terminal domain-containing protein n=1 Tax=Multifurca ochricompacta TaxID=376703 RepID=A0AAD4QQB1_9AGAM|nr:hypothetical protein B0F90DRAFT_1690235 [Multifurca ochricompacta]
MMTTTATATTANSSSSSPLKGKPKDDSTQSSLQSYWWNFYALVEQQQRPVAWTCSAILLAHESEPVIVGRAFPSSRHTPGSYAPPTVLSVSPDETWLFAYFPGRQTHGVGCIWRSRRADSWDVIESMNFPCGRGVVTAVWLGHAREWVTDSGRKTSRLPPLGPAMLASLPTLVLIMQNLQVRLCSVRSSAQESKVTTMSCSLEKHDEARDMSSVTSILDTPPGFESRSCTHAAIGLGYSETAILVATRSRTKAIHFESSDVSLGLDEVPGLTAHFHDAHSAESTDWESWAQESSVELCEVRLGFDGLRTHLSTSPLPPLRYGPYPLSSLIFCPGDPHLPIMAESSSGAVAARMYLCLSLLDFGKCENPTFGMEHGLHPRANSIVPKSELVVFGLYKRLHSQASILEWSSTRLASKVFSETLTFILPHHKSSRANTIVAGSLSTQATGSYSKRSTLAKVPSGHVTVLQLQSLEAHPDWGSEPLLLGWSESTCGYPPLGIAISPNAALFCAVSQSAVTASRLSVHSMPKRLQKGVSVSQLHPVPDFVSALVSAVKSKSTISDVAHQLSITSVSVKEVEGTLCEVLEALETQDDGLRDVWFHEFLGILLEIYRYDWPRVQCMPSSNFGRLKGERTQKTFEREDLKVRWRTVLDMCSVIACHSAFQDCMDGDSVELDNMWPLTVLSAWFVDFLEELLRECVLLGDSKEGLVDEIKEKQTIPSTHPILLNLLFPDALAKLRATVSDVKQFYEHLKNVDPNGENGAISKSVLLDTVDSSGVNLEVLELLLTQISKKMEGSNAVDVRQSLAACNPVPAVHRLLWGIARTVSKSDSIDKSRLFIKPLEFATEVGKVRKSSEYVVDGQDIVSKGILLPRRLTRVCVRCEGKTQQHDVVPRGDVTVPGSFSLQWQAWGRRWSTRCICGGRWVGIN